MLLFSKKLEKTSQIFHIMPEPYASLSIQRPTHFSVHYREKVNTDFGEKTTILVTKLVQLTLLTLRSLNYGFALEFLKYYRKMQPFRVVLDFRQLILNFDQSYEFGISISQLAQASKFIKSALDLRYAYAHISPEENTIAYHQMFLPLPHFSLVYRVCLIQKVSRFLF